MGNDNKTYSIEKSPLFELKSRKKLLEIFYIRNYKILENLAINKANYKVYSIDNKNKATKRKIEEPKHLLKAFHRRFNALLQRINVPDYVKAGRKGSCYVDNGKAHINGKYFFCSDVEKFFPSSRKQKVFQFEPQNNEQQQWHIVSVGDYYEIISKLNKKLLFYTNN